MVRAIAGLVFFAISTLGDDLPAWCTLQLANYAAIVGENTTETELVQYEENPRIFVIDFGGVNSLARQGKALNCVATLVEKSAAAQHRLLTDDELAAAIKKSRASCPPPLPQIAQSRVPSSVALLSTTRPRHVPKLQRARSKEGERSFSGQMPLKSALGRGNGGAYRIRTDDLLHAMQTL